MHLLKPAAAYFGLVFGIGFVMGTIRVLLIVPRLGDNMAELLETPLMLIACALAALWINQRFPGTQGPSAKLGIGGIALGLLLLAELVVGVELRGMSPVETLVHLDPMSGTAYYLSLILFAAMPWLLSRR